MRMSELERAAARMVCIGFDGLKVTAELRALIERGVRAVILFTRNFESRAQLTELCREIRSLGAAAHPEAPMLICTDHEGGRVQRFREGFTAIPSMREIGRIGGEEEARLLGRIIARELREAGIDMNLSPVLDVDTNPANPVIGDRSFSDDPEIVTRLGKAMIDGLQRGDVSFPGVMACGKHFPGHGDTSIDSHLGLPRLPHSMDRLHRVELPPFRAAIETGVAAIMAAHIVFDALDPGVPATLSRRIIDGLLRGELGFDGLVISDDMEMKAIADHFGFEDAVTSAVRAGLDLIMVCHTPGTQHRAIDAITGAIGDRVIDADRILASSRRFDQLRERFGIASRGRPLR
jgi:beta-N-acetylhexosaminidase